MRQVTYTVRHLDIGGWLATVQEEGDQPRPLAVSRGSELPAAAEMIVMIFIDVRTRERQRHEGSTAKRQAVSGGLIPALSRDFASEQLRDVQRGHAVTFTDDFIARWFTRSQQRADKALDRRQRGRRSGHLTKVQPN
ncbi:MAG: hypothetical protein E6I69_08570 [Chloroflexi bacterium]|nr:MAG: hypothetical protein AUI15_31995 [Actinobacteria bacterium 13_2_20CM_2_66_6]TME07183.1 MAG: hypothetical protein E6I69_08570 [Chloroflexota bacterium]TME93783.1 MAG: hypothetical protein E6I34_04985 [Chloroflexota bacterium]